MNTSATGGYLAPILTTPPQEDNELDTIFQNFLVGVIGLPGNFVRPRWQAVEPKQPDPSVNWLAFSLNEIKPDANAAIVHDSVNNQDDYNRHTEIELFATFYGPNRNFYADVLRDGIFIPQNIEALKVNLINIIKSGTIIQIPELVNEQWIRRSDVRIYFRRKIQRQYAVENLLGMTGAINAVAHDGTIIIDPLTVT